MGTVSKALGLLDLLAQPDARLGLTDIARLSGHDKATTRRLLVELMANGFVEQDEMTRDYLLGPALLMLGRAREDRFPFFKTVMPAVRALAEAAGETAHASEYSAGGMTSVCSQQSDKSNRVIVQTGERLPMHATASGLAFLASSTDAFVDSVLRKPQVAFTAHTLVSPEAIRALIAEARARGYVVCSQLREVGVHSVAAAILNPRGAPVGAIALAAPTARADQERIAAMGKLVAEAAAEISIRLYGRTVSKQRT
jgi:IclR family transcriptional regulator, acetate operon repressor